MSELKKEFRWFNIMDYKKEETYLSKRHQKGWKFKKVTFPGIYTFEKCEPENVIYQLDYNKDGGSTFSSLFLLFNSSILSYLLIFFSPSVQTCQYNL